MEKTRQLHTKGQGSLTCVQRHTAQGPASAEHHSAPCDWVRMCGRRMARNDREQGPGSPPSREELREQVSLKDCQPQVKAH